MTWGKQSTAMKDTNYRQEKHTLGVVRELINK